jgi:hypothetical protein
MDETVRKELEAQLGSWGLKIDGLVAEVQVTNVRAAFEAHMHIDELKALHATAQSKFDALKAAGSRERPRLESARKIAWQELEAALGSPKRSPQAMPGPATDNQGRTR